ncbi:hypothetical protein QF021_004411 [Acidovorax delafieldii]|nr:hypothetical protein [Acidovorax delafieldii]
MQSTLGSAQRVNHRVHKQKRPLDSGRFALAGTALFWLREKDLNLRPLGYEPNELPDCSIAR